MLLYHRICELESDPLLLSVSPANFATHLEIIRDHFEPISLAALAQAIENKTVPARSIVVTFDDGYRDNLTEAKPVLQRFNTPATVFVATGYIRSNEEFWWDALERIFLTGLRLPSRLQLRIGERMIDSRLETSLNYQKSNEWDITMGEDPSARHSVFRELLGILPTLPGTTIREAIQELQNWAGVEARGRASHQTINPGELVSLASGDLIEIGAHTVNHPALAESSAQEQRREVGDSKRDLEDLLGRPVNGFAYPFGTTAHYNSVTVNAVRDAKFRYACSNFAGKGTRLTDAFQIPRLLVRDWGQDDFRRLLEVGHV